MHCYLVPGSVSRVNTKFQIHRSKQLCIRKVKVKRMADDTYSIEELKQITDNKISLGHELITKLNEFDKIDGVTKVQRKILKEIKFLCKIKQKETVKIQHLNCSNLTYYSFLVENIISCENLKYVEYPLHVSYRDEPLKIDIICDNGRTWIKVIARNSKTINDAVSGRGEYGTKSILDKGEEYIQAAKENYCFFQAPKAVFKFSKEIPIALIAELEMLGIKVVQPQSSNNLEDNICSAEYIIDKLNNKFQLTDTNSEIITVLNLDISTLLAYVSSLTNGGECYKFKDPLLNEQAICEQTTHVKQILDKLFVGKKLICCQTAVNSFKEIIDMLAGPQEIERANDLLSRLTVLPDLENIELLDMKISGKVKQRSLIIFSFGLYYQAISVTSNEGFIRSAKMQGYNIPAFVHEARALTELKGISVDNNLSPNC